MSGKAFSLVLGVAAALVLVIGLREFTHAQNAPTAAANDDSAPVAAPQPDSSATPDANTNAVDYLTQIKPLLTQHCYDCHAAEVQQSGFRLDTAESAQKGGDHGPAIVAGQAEKSLLFQVLVGQSDVKRMPDEADPLPATAIALIKQWIDAGAIAPADEQPQQASNPERNGKHWAFQTIAKPAVPDITGNAWVRNPIDAFIVRALNEHGLQPSPEAEPTTLIRRLSLDIRGTLPSIDEVDAFLADQQPGAYERLVDRMLDAPEYGERWGRHWLDAARYADSNGFTIDGPRSIWKYRDWVIDAINADLPFDQFTIEQLAGDMLPDATESQVIATGFHRNTLVNEEGGTDDEQFRVEAVSDRVDTMGSVYLGLTLGCARCHEHKYDPITQREYYNLFAIFNNCDEPTLQVPNAQQKQHLGQLHAEIDAVKKLLAAREAEHAAGLPAWEQTLAGQGALAWTSLDPAHIAAKNGTVITRLDDQSLVTDFSVPATDVFTLTCDAKLEHITGVRLEALTHPSLPMMGPGRAPNGNFVLSEFTLEAVPLNEQGQPLSEPVKISIARAVADHAQVGYAVAQTIDGNQSTGWAVDVETGSLNVDREAVFVPEQPLDNKHGYRLVVHLHQNHSEAGYLLGRFRLSATGMARELLDVPSSIRNIASLPKDKRTETQQQQLAAAYKQTDALRAPIAARLDELKRREDQLVRQIPTTLVMKELPQPRETHINIRGDFLRPGARVTGGAPAAVACGYQLPKRPTRLDFARWLVAADNPLTSRVTVNRIWQGYFGFGLVRTENDFGTQGSPPTHPELLDWLAGEFIRQGWSMKSLHRLIVTSATYRQLSVMRAELSEADPDNRWLGRQNRLRLEAEAIRDVALSASGLLSRKMKGPSVYPPQPEGIYVLTQQKKAWPEETGEDRHRRGMYTYFWRSSPYPLFPTFDAPDANTACTRRTRSNTPLQALTLANDRAFFELAEGLGARIVSAGPADHLGRIRFAFRICLSRAPSAEELTTLAALMEKERSSNAVAQASAAPATGAQLSGATDVSGSPPPTTDDWTALARVLLNVDEFITRE